MISRTESVRKGFFNLNALFTISDFGLLMISHLRNPVPGLPLMLALAVQECGGAESKQHNQQNDKQDEKRRVRGSLFHSFSSKNLWTVAGNNV